MRHNLLHRPGLGSGLARHRPRPPNWSRADGSQARGTDIVLAILGLALLGGLCLFFAAHAIGPTLGS